MTASQSIQTCFQKYATFNGTASRSEYWWFFLFTLVISSAIAVFSNKLSIVFSLATLVPSFAVAARRLHDTDRSGWWQLIILVPLIGFIVLLVFLAQEGKSNRYGTAPAYAA
ncbi:DUF805 domain-containing protein [Massilia rhizosphaerae]|uniref:DUF805 domain-containing protein n=1 Tax=Massilia rhizosphaerae TaxID=2784389 RepID=UPI0018DB8951|nr:DUF805 domain-containing protein [Massilia rhizosphaerae]